MLSKSIKYSQNSINPEQCHECALKQKYVSGCSSKCIKHMFQEKQKQVLSQQFTKYEEIMNNLKNIQQLLPLYSIQTTLSATHQNFLQVNDILKQIDQIKAYFMKIKDHSIQSSTSLSNFSINSPFDSIKKSSQTPDMSTFDRRQDSVSAFQIQNQIMNQNIKDWVVYFSQKLLLNNQKNRFLDSFELPFQEDPEMRNFKQKMNQKYAEFMKKVQNKDRLLNDAINKLVQFVESDEKKGKRSNSFFDMPSKLRSKINNSLSIQKVIKLSKTQSGRQTSRIKSKQKPVDSFNINSSSFLIDNVSVCASHEISNQNSQETYLLLLSQAHCIQDLLQSTKEESLLL